MRGSVAGFERRQGVLEVDGVDLHAIGGLAGTPCHVYSASLLTERFTRLDRAFAGVPHRIHYALKANSTLAVVRHLRGAGASADVNSGGELEVALAAGFEPSEIVFTGVGKTRDEIARAVSLGVAALNAESFGEIDRIADAARSAGRTANVALRVNPDVEAGSHRHISTGSHRTKFGVSLDEAREMIDSVARHDRLRLVGLHVHVGSQITAVEPLARGVAVVVGFAQEISARGLPLSHLDIGGGLGIAYQPGQPVVTPEEWAATVIPLVQPTGLTLVVEPGRWIVGPAGVLLTEIVDIKHRPEGGRFVIVDAGMTDLLRPALYDAWHEIEPVRLRPGASQNADVVGPVCETTDSFATARPLPPVDVGDLLAIRDTGAYGAVMASNYNRRPLAAEVMVDRDGPRIVRRRQTIDDMLQWER
jgi:diaminopimelate decarboxylase